MKAVITVLGKDRTGIIAAVSNLLYQKGVNILDISQTILSGMFTMIMLVESTPGAPDFGEMQSRLQQKGEQMGVAIRVQREDIFNAMHTI